YDTFTSESCGSQCEAVSLASNENIKVRVLCAPTNIRMLKAIYQEYPNVTVEELRFDEYSLNTRRMLDLMAVSDGNLPLYLHVVQRILRDLRLAQQHNGSSFDYGAFKQKLSEENLAPQQLAPLKQRLETLESFMVESQAKKGPRLGGKKKKKSKVPASTAPGTDWTPRNGTLTVVDLSCPCVTPEMACSLFNICLSLFLEEGGNVGKVVALDEAHKYMTDSPECKTLTESLLATIRLQRHMGVRVIISTQEPTISPKLLDLCSVTIVHRFTSPDWLRALSKHLAGVSSVSLLLDKAKRSTLVGEDDEEEEVEVGALKLGGEGDPKLELFSEIVGLRVGEALIFAPSAIMGVDETRREVKRLGHGVMKIRVRKRVTDDGGMSFVAD
ncbi:hypothetical protein B0T21DRAFT_294281, partial [Apiosordaria backusii]